MDLGLAGRSALVCASTAGLGLGAVSALANEGANTIVSGRRAELAAQLADALPGRSVGLASDLTQPGAGARLAAAAQAALGPIDVLVLNGPGPAPGLAAAVDPDAVAAAVDLLVRPHIELINALLPSMRERGWGRIVAIGSSGVVAPLANLVLSNLGRSALRAYLKTLAAEVAGDGVTVNMVLPGRIATARVESLDAAAAGRTGQSVEDVRSASEAAIPTLRYGTIEEFGATVAFVASAPASYITGTAIRCDGGLLASM